MRKILLCMVPVFIVFMVAGWSSESTIAGGQNKINVKGMLSTHANPDEREVENIAIGGLTEGIVFYPVLKDEISEVKILKENPDKGEKDYLDFIRDIAIISIPDPADIWTYEESNNGKVFKKVKYIVVQVELKAGASDKEGKVERYLVNLAHLITCRVMDDGVVIDKKVPLAELKKLTITSTVLKDAPAKKKGSKTK